MKKIDFGSNQFFIKKYEELKSSEKMAQFYNCSKTTVLNHAKKIGYDTSSNKNPSKLSKQDKERIISLYNEKTSTELAEQYKVSRGMITKIWYDANLKGKQLPQRQKYDLTGQRINNLTVISKTENRDASGCIMWLCKCDCGNYKEISSTRLKTGKAKSCGCLSKEALKIGQGLNFNDLTGQVFGKLTVLKRCQDKIFNQSKRAGTQWLCKCSCGRQVKVLSSNLITENTQSCGFCNNNSHGNIKIENLLKSENIPFEREKRFNDCIDKVPLPFDFYVNNQYIIEYDGKQHFSDQDTIFNYEEIHKHDLIKNEYCKNNNIPLIRIPYTEYDNLTIKDLKLETTKFLI